MRSTCLALATLVTLASASLGVAGTASFTSVNVSRSPLTGTPKGPTGLATPIFDQLGVPLDDGVALVPGDGDQMRIVEFVGVPLTLDPALWGPNEWNSAQPLTGPDSPNPGLNLTSGDGNDLNGGAFPGFISIGLTWNTDDHAQRPDGAARLGIEVFNHPDKDVATHRNVFTSFGATWVGRDAANSPPPSPNELTLDVPENLVSLGEGQLNSSSLLETSVLIPEPSSSLLALLGLGVLLRRRRR